MKKFLIYVLFFMFFSANAVLAVTYSSRPAIPFTETGISVLFYKQQFVEPPTISKNITNVQYIETMIKYFNKWFEVAGYDFPKSLDKAIHEYRKDPMGSGYNGNLKTVIALSDELCQQYTQEEENILKKYFSQETVKFLITKEENTIEEKIQKSMTKNPPTTTYSKNDGQSQYNQTDAQTQVVSQKTDSNEWNIWRSNIQNEIMAKAKIKAPTGTMFMFTFNVDKYGRISYLKIWAKPETYSSLAQDVLSPIILKLQGTSILSFPANSQREATNVNGGFTMSDTTKYSSPTDYNDKENKTVPNPIQNNIQNNYNPYNNVIQQSNYQNTYNQNNTNRNNNNSNKNYSNVINDAMGIVRDVNSIIRTWK